MIAKSPDFEAVRTRFARDFRDMCAVTAKSKYLFVIRYLRSKHYGLLEASLKNCIKRGDLEIPIARDICILVILVDIRDLDHCLKILVSLPLYTKNRGAFKRSSLMGLEILILINTYINKYYKVYLDLNLTSGFE